MHHWSMVRTWPVPLAVLAMAVMSPPAALALDNGLARTPQMGFNTWNSFAGNINEGLLKDTADRMAELGLITSGYIYLNVDDGWMAPQRDASGRLAPNLQRFPSGMKTLGNYIHGKGLRFGIYSDSGLRTCMGLPASRMHEEKDADTFASWGVDYLKYDNCFTILGDSVQVRYEAMRDALNKTGRPVLFSMCEWGVAEPWLWASGVGNSWRTTEDIGNSWNEVVRNLDETVGLANYAGPGAWNDPDMLEVGNGGLTHGEERAHFALWSILKAPLIIGADLRSISNASLSVLMSSEVIALNQDALGVPGDLVWKQGSLEVYAAPLQGGARGMVLLNRHADDIGVRSSDVTVPWAHIGLPEHAECTVRDLYAGEDVGTFQGSFTAQVPVHDVLAARVTCTNGSKVSDSWRPWHVVGSMYDDTRLDRNDTGSDDAQRPEAE